MGAVQLAGTCDSASEVGGDFFDVIPLAEGEVLVAIGDAMGKGLPAAMFALMLRGLIRALRDYASSPGGLLTRANALLHEELSRVDMFITAQLAYVNANERRLILANAGHCPALVVRAGTQAVEVHSPDGMPLGVLPQATFAEECVELADGVRCLLYTDGVTESTAADGSGLLGQRRLGEWLATLSPQPGGVEALKSGLMDLLAGFRNHQPPSDDQTFVVVGS
jgi:serine phosphatase RsbU (regulator of sigma subunit)